MNDDPSLFPLASIERGLTPSHSILGSPESDWLFSSFLHGRKKTDRSLLTAAFQGYAFTKAFS